MHRANEAAGACSCDKSQEPVSRNVYLVASKRVEDGWIRTSHYQHTYSSVVETSQYFIQVLAVDLKQVEEGWAAQAEAGTKQMNYQRPPRHVGQHEIWL